MSGRTAIAATAFFVMTAGTALAAGPDDGTWEGQCSSEGRCRGDMQMTVTDSQSTGTYSSVAYEVPVKGSIAADGTFDGILTGKTVNMTLRGKFAGNSFTGGYKFRDFTYHITLQKAP